MYNLFQYVNKRQQLNSQQNKVKQEAQYLLKHQQFKNYAFQKMKDRADEFLLNQNSSQQPFIFQDDHYRTWREHKQYRDVQDSNKFVGFKTFRHRPNEDMDKYYTDRQRKEMQFNQLKKDDLVKSGILQMSQISRSQRSQGPYNPKIQFRVTKKDQEYLQPRLRYSNITDKQRMSQSAIIFNEKASKIYSKFQANKSRLGRVLKSNMSRYYDETCSGVHVGQFQKKKSLSLMKKTSNNIEQPEEREISILDSTKISQYLDQRNQTKRKDKTYFKLSKTMQMLHPDQHKRLEFSHLLKKSQYDRTKNLNNINKNTFNENYLKDPIL